MSMIRQHGSAGTSQVFLTHLELDYFDIGRYIKMPSRSMWFPWLSVTKIFKIFHCIKLRASKIIIPASAVSYKAKKIKHRIGWFLPRRQSRLIAPRMWWPISSRFLWVAPHTILGLLPLTYKNMTIWSTIYLPKYYNINFLLVCAVITRWIGL